MKKIIILSLACASVVCTPYEPNKLIAAINQNKLAQFITQKAAAFTTQIPSQQASQEYQEFACEAKLAFNCTLPIKVAFAPEHMVQTTKKMTGLTFAGMYIPGMIFINEKKLSNQAHGLKRFTIYHEIAHAYYHDQSNLVILSDGTFIPAYLLSWASANRLIKHFNLRCWGTGTMGKLLFSLIPTSIIQSTISNHYQYYCEHRADLCAAHKIKCPECLRDVVHRRMKWSAKKAAFGKKCGYLTVQELEAIAREYQDPENLCTYHKQLPNS